MRIKTILLSFVFLSIFFFLPGTANADVIWNDFDEKVVDDLVNECAKSRKIKEFTEEQGRVPLVVLGEISNNTGEDIDVDVFARRLQNAVINSKGVLDFVASGEQRQALRDEKRDQDFHAGIDSAKAIDNETAADFMLLGDLNLLKAASKKLSCQLVIQLYDIESNRIVFSSVKDVTIKGVKVAAQKSVGERSDEITFPRWQLSGSDWDVYKTHSIAVPVICRDFDGDGGDAECEFRAVAVGYDLSIFKINVPTNITLMMKLGAGIGGGTISADYGMGDEVEKSDNLDFITYGRIGAGFALTLGNWLLIPTAGVGLSLEGLGDFEDEDEDEDSDEKEYVGYDATVDAFVNLTAILMFSNRIGLSFSFEVSTNLCGAGSFTELETYSINFGQLSFTPAIGICCRR